MDPFHYYKYIHVVGPKKTDSTQKEEFRDTNIPRVSLQLHQIQITGYPHIPTSLYLSFVAVVLWRVQICITCIKQQCRKQPFLIKMDHFYTIDGHNNDYNNKLKHIQ